ncbi:hypothetical protein CTheo_5675 [Ceratobasidium theobromae]|uniref:Uncharacterized protein n=1 Tax=Ceratobasidium theobromae TaxID=1582974 RepID=A0A5N5QGK5_9AGAM|nr:hypothetical protein CTheo_5675 [Ceratobasidium theobromae]
MPAPVSAPRARPVLGHVNLMTDTLIANSTVDDLRAIVRALLATGPPSTASAFSAVARTRLAQSCPKTPPHPSALFAHVAPSADPRPTPALSDLLARARAHFGSGMGLHSLTLLVVIVRATVDLRWADDGPLADTLAVVDADIAQAVQSTKEELLAGRVDDMAHARKAVDDLRTAMREVELVVALWGADFPFERGLANLESLKL